jgi:sterol desaturase/sphingolipid hydroxylase (fatty acid hydroxylase superfamily)
MDDGHASLLRFGVLVVVFLAVALAEWFCPRRTLVMARAKRWITHALFFATNTAIGRLLALLIAIPLAAQWSADAEFGLFYQLALPIWVQTILAFILLDFAVWLQHLAMHKLPFLWRMHKVHHADRDLDVTTALRFHPFELVLSTLYKAAWVALLGVPVAIALAFEVWLNANALFNHGNMALPRWLDRIVRPFLVTPDMHLVHHSTVIGEQQSNYGFALTVWDRLLGTYRNEAATGHEAHAVGLAEAQDDRPAHFLWSAKLPFY